MLPLILISIGLVALLTAAWWYDVRLLASVVLLLALVARYSLFSSGTLYGAASAWAANAILVAVALGAVVTFVLHRPRGVKRTNGATGSWSQPIATAGILIALPAGLIGLAQIAAPATPAATAAPPCPGAPVAGGAFFATTSSVGNNARSGPDLSYPQVQRFAANCTLSFSGYCIGQPVTDVLVKDEPDQRWLILHRAWQTWPWSEMPWAHDQPYEFVAAGQVQSQSPESALGAKASAICPRHGGWSSPSPITLATAVANERAAITVRAPGSYLVGFSIGSSKPPVGGTGDVIGFPVPAPNLLTDGALATVWNASVTTAHVHAPATLTLVASVCLAPAVADPGNYAAQQFFWNGHTVQRLSQVRRISDISRMQTEACSVSPEYPGPPYE